MGRKMNAPSPIRVLGLCGLLSAAFSTIGGFSGEVWLIGVASSVMLVGNLYAMVKGP